MQDCQQSCLDCRASVHGWTRKYGRRPSVICPISTRTSLVDPLRTFDFLQSGRSTYVANGAGRMTLVLHTPIAVYRPMKFEIEGKVGISTPTLAQISRGIKSLRSYGPSSYASLTNERGNYVQVAGGSVTCMVEHFDAGTRTRSRAFHDKSNPAFPDGTILAFRAGNIPMRSDEWFMSTQVIDIFSAFLNNASFPAYVHWRTAPGF